jgi:hypothetical protein
MKSYGKIGYPRSSFSSTVTKKVEKRRKGAGEEDRGKAPPL